MIYLTRLSYKLGTNKISLRDFYVNQQLCEWVFDAICTSHHSAQNIKFQKLEIVADLVLGSIVYLSCFELSFIGELCARSLNKLSLSLSTS